MKLEEMFEKLENHNIYTDYLVRIKYKYDWEEEYEAHNEILEAYNGKFVWLNDWNEGQTDVEVLGFVAIEDIPISKVVKWVAEEGSDLLFSSEEVNDPSGTDMRGEE